MNSRTLRQLMCGSCPEKEQICAVRIGDDGPERRALVLFQTNAFRSVFYSLPRSDLPYKVRLMPRRADTLREGRPHALLGGAVRNDFRCLVEQETGIPTMCSSPRAETERFGGMEASSSSSARAARVQRLREEVLEVDDQQASGVQQVLEECAKGEAAFPREMSLTGSTTRFLAAYL